MLEVCRPAQSTFNSSSYASCFVNHAFFIWRHYFSPVRLLRDSGSPNVQEAVSGQAVDETNSRPPLEVQSIAKYFGQGSHRLPNVFPMPAAQSVTVIPFSLLMQAQDPANFDRIASVNKKIDATKLVLHKTIESVLLRGERLDQLMVCTLRLCSMVPRYRGETSRGFGFCADADVGSCVLSM